MKKPTVDDCKRLGEMICEWTKPFGTVNGHILASHVLGFVALHNIEHDGWKPEDKCFTNLCEEKIKTFWP